MQEALLLPISHICSPACIDLVWFKDPFPYFRDKIKNTAKRSKMTGSYLEAFLSDDGQRSLRYAPFYGNSGFYYLLGSARSENFAYGIMSAFDAVQVPSRNCASEGSESFLQYFSPYLRFSSKFYNLHILLLMITFIQMMTMKYDVRFFYTVCNIFHVYRWV